MALSTRRMGLTRIDGLALDGTPIERRMLAVVKNGLTIGQADPVLTTEQIPGRTGLLDVTLEDATGAAMLGMRDITLDLYALGGEDDILTAKQWLGGLNGRTTSMSWRGLPGEYRGRLAVGPWTDHWAGDRQTHGTVTITLTAMPHLYGRTRAIQLTSGVNTLAIAGNRPCWPTWTLTPTSGAKTVAISDGPHRFEINAASVLSGTITVTTDPDGRETRINGNLRTPTLASDYFPLTPGVNTITLTNCTGRLDYEPLTII